MVLRLQVNTGRASKHPCKKKDKSPDLSSFFSADVDIASGQGVTCNFRVQCPFLQWEVLVIYISLFFICISLFTGCPFGFPGKEHDRAYIFGGKPVQDRFDHSVVI